MTFRGQPGSLDFHSLHLFTTKYNISFLTLSGYLYNNLKERFFLEFITHPQCGTFAYLPIKKRGRIYLFPR